MSEELEQRAVGEEDSAESIQPTGQEDRQPEEQAKPINLDDLPEFRKWKSETDKRLSQLQRQAQQEAQERQRLEQERERIMLERMDEDQRKDYQIQKYEQMLRDMQKQRELDQMAWQKNQDIMEVANELGLDREELEAALPADADSFVLWKVGNSLAKKKGTGKRSPELEAARTATERVHVGTGSGPAKNKWQQMLDEAKREHDANKYLDALAGAAQDNIFLE